MRLIRELDRNKLIPEPWDLVTFLRDVARWRSRPIKVYGRDGDYWATGAQGDYLSGLYVAMANTDVILYRTDGGWLTSQHIVAHEVGHLLAGHAHAADTSTHPATHPSTEPVTQEDVLRRSCARSRFDDPEERVAEAFADLLMASVSRRGTPEQHRLAQLLGRRVT
jgi:hypothetical protein